MLAYAIHLKNQTKQNLCTFILNPPFNINEIKTTENTRTLNNTQTT